MKIIFLDIDGVLNSNPWLDERERLGLIRNRSLSDKIEENNRLHPDMVARLNAIIEATDAQIIVSSTWRLTRAITDLQDILTRNGCVGKVFGATGERGEPREWMEARKEEILDWLEQFGGKVDSFVILDDIDDMGPIQKYLVNTDWGVGLEEKHVEQAIEILQ